MLVESENVMIPNLAWQTIYLAAFLRLEHKLVFGFGCCRHFDFFLFNSLWTSSPKWLTVTFSLIYVALRTWYLAWEHFVALLLVLLPSFSVNGNSAWELIVLQGSCSYPGRLRWFCNPECSPVPYLTCRVESSILFWWGLAGVVVRVAGERSCLLVI